MKKIFLALIVFLLSSTVLANDTSEAVANFKKSAQVKRFFDQAYGYAIFPTVGKGGFGIGGSYGEGSVF